MIGVEIVYVDFQVEFVQVVYFGQQVVLGFGGVFGQFQCDLFQVYVFFGYLVYGEIDEIGVGDVFVGDVDVDVEVLLFFQ